jgi:hypothetical protein
VDQTLTIENVPSADVDRSIADLKKLGAKDVTKIDQGDGNFTLVATFPATGSA